MYRKSRDISYEDESAVQGDDVIFTQDISRLLTSFAGTQRKVLIVGNEPSLWQKVSSDVCSQIRLVLQELMVNMKKHSRATEVVLRFQVEDNQFALHYSDNGVGFSETHHVGNGLRNTENRIEGLGGTCTFVSEKDKGVRISCFIPLT